jgi:hypothetical protein
LRDGIVSLNRHFAYVEFNCRPAKGRIAENVFLGIGITARYETDPVGEDGQWLLPRVGKQPFLGQGLAKPLNPRQQITQAHRTNVFYGHVEPARLNPKFCLE